jgi:hypothetical protein
MPGGKATGLQRGAGGGRDDVGQLLDQTELLVAVEPTRRCE